MRRRACKATGSHDHVCLGNHKGRGATYKTNRLNGQAPPPFVPVFSPFEPQTSPIDCMQSSCKWSPWAMSSLSRPPLAIAEPHHKRDPPPFPVIMATDARAIKLQQLDALSLCTNPQPPKPDQSAAGGPNFFCRSPLLPPTPNDAASLRSSVSTKHQTLSVPYSPLSMLFEGILADSSHYSRNTFGQEAGDIPYSPAASSSDLNSRHVSCGENGEEYSVLQSEVSSPSPSSTLLGTPEAEERDILERTLAELLAQNKDMLSDAGSRSSQIALLRGSLLLSSCVPSPTCDSSVTFCRPPHRRPVPPLKVLNDVEPMFSELVNPASHSSLAYLAPDVSSLSGSRPIGCASPSPWMVKPDTKNPQRPPRPSDGLEDFGPTSFSPSLRSLRKSPAEYLKTNSVYTINSAKAERLEAAPQRGNRASQASEATFVTADIGFTVRPTAAISDSECTARPVQFPDTTAALLKVNQREQSLERITLRDPEDHRPRAPRTQGTRQYPPSSTRVVPRPQLLDLPPAPEDLPMGGRTRKTSLLRKLSSAMLRSSPAKTYEGPTDYSKELEGFDTRVTPFPMPSEVVSGLEKGGLPSTYAPTAGGAGRRLSLSHSAKHSGQERGQVIGVHSIQASSTTSLPLQARPSTRSRSYSQTSAQPVSTTRPSGGYPSPHPPPVSGACRSLSFSRKPSTTPTATRTAGSSHPPSSSRSRSFSTVSDNVPPPATRSRSYSNATNSCTSNIITSSHPLSSALSSKASHSSTTSTSSTSTPLPRKSSLKRKMSVSSNNSAAGGGLQRKPSRLGIVNSAKRSVERNRKVSFGGVQEFDRNSVEEDAGSASPDKAVKAGGENPHAQAVEEE